MKTADETREEMDAEDPTLDWEAEGGSGWETVKELFKRGQRDALQAAILACRKPEQDECMTGHVSECIRAIEALKP